MDHANLQPIYQQILNPLVVTILGGVATWLGVLVQSWTAQHKKLLGAQLDAQLNAGFNTALQNGINIALQSLNAYEGEHSEVAVKGWLASKAAQYAIDHSPDYLARFLGDNTPAEAVDHAAEKALAFLPPISVTAGTTGTTIKTEPVIVQTLPPVQKAS